MYGMSTSVLKCVSDVILTLLARPFNACLRLGVFLEKIKISRTIPSVQEEKS